MTKFGPVHAERLTILADRLDNNVSLGIGEFDISGWTSCAIAECPYIWPDFWHYINGDEPVMKRRIYCETSAMFWFGLTPNEINHLFVPHEQNTGKYGGMYLTNNASRKDVAAQIRAFVIHKDQKANAAHV